MPATFANVRAFAADFPEVTEGICYGTPALYVGRKLMARLWEDGETLVLKVDPARRAQLFETAPDTYFLTDHYRNYPVMLVNLLSISHADLKAAVEGAWTQLASVRQRKARQAAKP